MSIAFLIIWASFLYDTAEGPAKSPSSDPPVSQAAPDVPLPAMPADGGVPADAGAPDDGGTPAANRPPAAVLPVTPTSPTVDWSGLGRSSLRFIGVMHAFRLATEPGTRAGGFGLGSGYSSSVSRLHGWADGDPFYVNYVGHPMQGAVANYLWQINDTRFRHVEFGRSRDYWKSKLRGAAFAWAFSEQFEIGPLSEASIGHIQRDFPQQGLVDHVVTPSVGLAWTLAEDALDRYVVRPIEDRTYNRWVRLAVRSFLNPARSFANVLDSRPPWYRTSRAGILSYSPMPEAEPAQVSDSPELPDAAPFEFAPIPVWRRYGGNSCVGGGAEAAWRFATEWQMVASVTGCKMLGLEEDVSGDTLLYQVGPRWTPAAASKWSPYAHLLIGGLKVTQERFDPALKRAVLAANRALPPARSYTLHEQYTSIQTTNALALTAGIGVDYRLNSALALRVANVEYLRSNAPSIGGVPYGRGFQMSAGMVLRVGTW
jgi:hypothetical protein